MPIVYACHLLWHESIATNLVVIRTASTQETLMGQALEATTIARHGGFVIERNFPVPPWELFKVWTDPAMKARWFIGPDGWNMLDRAMDLRVGGEETLHGRFGNLETLFRARYHAIEPDRRIVYVYDMFVAGRHHSLSLATVEFLSDGKHTKQVFTEQVTFLDGTTGRQGTSFRKRGTAAHFDRIGALIGLSAGTRREGTYSPASARPWR
jgi:uncharacterized protein YndB with AHSA1/START domain